MKVTHGLLFDLLDQILALLLTVSSKALKICDGGEDMAESCHIYKPHDWTVSVQASDFLPLCSMGLIYLRFEEEKKKKKKTCKHYDVPKADLQMECTMDASVKLVEWPAQSI